MEPQMERNSTEFIFIFTFLTVVFGPNGWDGHQSSSERPEPRKMKTGLLTKEGKSAAPPDAE